MLNLCKLYFLIYLSFVCREKILIKGNIKPKKITTKPSKYSLFIINSLEILKIENSELKNQNSLIFANGKLTPNIKSINSKKLKKYINYESIVLISLSEISLNFFSNSIFSKGVMLGNCIFIIYIKKVKYLLNTYLTSTLQN